MNNYVKYVAPPTTTEILARSGEFYIQEKNSQITGHYFRLYKETPGNSHDRTFSVEHSKRELASDMRNQLFRDVKKLNELQPKIEAYRALLQELDNNGGDE